MGAMVKLAQRWLRAAGVQVSDDVIVEINPLWAANSEEVRRRVKAGTVISWSIYIPPDGPPQQF